LEGGTWQWKVDETDSGSCPMAGFGISSVEPAGSATTVLVNHYLGPQG